MIGLVVLYVANLNVPGFPACMRCQVGDCALMVVLLADAQVLLYKALGFKPPTFGHMSLILAPDKSKLSKRWGCAQLLHAAAVWSSVYGITRGHDNLTLQYPAS